MLKRGFDVAFSTLELLVLRPAILGIAVATKLDDGDSTLYKEERVAVFGETVDVYKLRSVVENAGGLTGAEPEKQVR